MGVSRDIRVEGSGAVRRVVLDRPARRNAQTVAMWRELDRVAAQLAEDPEVRCVVLSGAGGWFSSGLDLEELRPGNALAILTDPDGDTAARFLLSELQATFLWPTRTPFLVIAAVDGIAIGAGFELALACDVRFVADDARLQLPEVAMGTVPDLGACHHLRELLGYEQALDLLLQSTVISGAEAASRGLALRALPAADLHEAAMAYAEMVAAVTGPRTVRDLKAALRAPGSAASLSAAAAGMAAGLQAGGRRRD